MPQQAAQRYGERESQALRASSEENLIQCPPANQFLRVGLSGMRDECLQVSGIVYVESDAWKAQHLARFSGGLRRGEMRFEAIVREAQRKQVRWPAESGVGSTSVSGGHEHRALVGSMRKNLRKLAGLDQRNIRWNDERAPDAALHAEACGHLNCPGFARIRRIGDDFESIFLAKINRE